MKRNREITDRLLERIAEALERIAGAMEKPKVSGKVPVTISRLPGKSTKAGEVHGIIKAYIDAFRLRYGARARPDVGGRVQGLIKTLLKDYTTEQLTALVQAYCQMPDPWFETKCHDFPTLYENIGKVQTALLNGTARAGDGRFWSDVFGKGNGREDIRGTDRQVEGELFRQPLQGGAGQGILEGPREST